MSKKKIFKLRAEQRAELEKGNRKDKNHVICQRCQMILLKSENRNSMETAEFPGVCEVAINCRTYAVEIFLTKHTTVKRSLLELS